jgi:NAD(P)-dependent dehydrogenase (short-subunit alcohol dehydrogenase family)
LSDALSGVALVTGGGRGIGERVARELTAAGMRVAVTGRTAEQVEAVARVIDGLALVGDVAEPGIAAEWVERTEAELGPIELLAANAGRAPDSDAPTWDQPAEDWWNTFEVNVLGVHLCCCAVIPRMLDRGSGRIVITGSGASYLPGSRSTAYPASKAAAGRYGETLASELDGRIPVFVISPGLVKTDMTASFSDDAPWTPPELAPALIRVLASGRADALAGRYIHAEHDDIEDLIRRSDEIRERDLNAIRIQR